MADTDTNTYEVISQDGIDVLIVKNSAGVVTKTVEKSMLISQSAQKDRMLQAITDGATRQTVQTQSQKDDITFLLSKFS